MKNRNLVFLVLAILLLVAVVVRARGGGFLRCLAPMIHGTPSH